VHPLNFPLVLSCRPNLKKSASGATGVLDFGRQTLLTEKKSFCVPPINRMDDSPPQIPGAGAEPKNFFFSVSRVCRPKSKTPVAPLALFHGKSIQSMAV
jgi:hypothetical protein